MLKTYRYRLYPNPQQIAHLAQAFGCVRYIYNKALEHKTKHYAITKKNLSYCELSNKFLKQEKQSNLWLAEPSSQSLQMALRNLDTAYQNFFKKRADFPKFKSKHHKNSIQYPQSVKVDWKNNTISVPKCGEISAVLHRHFLGKIKTCTLTKNSAQQYYISILVEDSAILPAKSSILADTTVGIDLGIKNYATLSNGQKLANPKYFTNSLSRLKREQRKLSHKQKGSKNRAKQRLKVAKIHNKIANQRKNFLHQLIAQLIKSESQTFVLENLSIKKMLQNSSLAQAISDCSWHQFYTYLEYKSNWAGKNVILIDRFEPTSQLCSNCGWQNQKLQLEDREWICQQCQTKHDRDWNAAKNIKQIGLKKSGQELPVALAVKQEASSLMKK